MVWPSGYRVQERKRVGVSRGLMMLCDICYAQVIADKLTDEKNFVADADTLFDTICCGCTDINRPLMNNMAGSRWVMVKRGREAGMANGNND